MDDRVRSYVAKSIIVGKRIRARRRALNLSQEALATKVGVTRITVTIWETGKSAISKPNIDALCKALKVSEDDLLENVNLATGRLLDANKAALIERAEETPEAYTAGPITPPGGTRVIMRGELGPGQSIRVRVNSTGLVDWTIEG